MIESLDRDGLLCVVSHLPLAARGRLARVNASLAELLRTDEAWCDQIAAYGLQGRSSDEGARSTLEHLHKLDAANWSHLHAEADGLASLSLNMSAPPWRDHFVAQRYRSKLIIFGGQTNAPLTNESYNDHRGMSNETWVCDLITGNWTNIEHESSHSVPSPRIFNADAGGGRVVDFGVDGAWLCVFGGLHDGMRDNETWMLGPLDEPLVDWRWFQVQEDGRAQSMRRPKPRFHHTLNVIRRKGDDRDTFLVWGGHDWTIRPIGALGVLQCKPKGGDGSDDGATGIEERVEWSMESGWRHGPGDVHRDPRAKANPSAAVWRCNGAEHLVVVGGTTGTGSTSFATFLFDTTTFQTHRLEDYPTTLTEERACIMRDQLIVYDASGVISLLRLSETVGGNASGFSCGAWMQIPLRAAVCCDCRLRPQLGTLFNEEILVVFGGFNTLREGDIDHFGDPQTGWNGLHETLALRIPQGAEAADTLKPIECTAGLPLQTVDSGRLLDPYWESERFMLHSLVGAPELNGRVGRRVASDVEERVGLEIEMADSTVRQVAVRPTNIVPSQSDTTSAMVIDEDGTEAIAIHCSTVCGQETNRSGCTMALSRLSMLPKTAERNTLPMAN